MTPSERKRAYMREYAKKNRDRFFELSRRSFQRNKEKVLARNRIKQRSPEGKAYHKRYREQNRDKTLEYLRQWRAENQDKIKSLRQSYKARRNHLIQIKFSSDAKFKIQNALRCRVRAALNGKGIKSSRTLDLLGCSVDYLISHLERQFQVGMNWSNHGQGRGKWHVDHKIPCAAFDLTDPVSQKRCFHFTNLQPLWSHENISKNAKY